VLIAAVIAASGTALAEPVRLEADTEVASAGYFQLRWFADTAIELQESPTPDFSSPRLVYSGRDKARVMSGKSDGEWYYRARPTRADAAWSNTVKVTVLHHPIERAFGFFALGAVVFLGTALVITKGARERA